VLEEVVVLGGEHGVDHLIRNRIERERDPPLLAELGDELAVAAVDAQRHAQPDVLDGRDVRQRRMQILITAEQRQHDRAERADTEREQDTGRRREVTSHHNKKS
jgi:hypothetical protein